MALSPFTDVDRINEVANHPSVAPHIGAVGWVDLSCAVVAPNFALFGEHGGLLMSWSSPFTFEVHTLILPDGRGKWAFQFVNQAIDYMRNTGIKRLWTRVRHDARHTALFTKKMGFQEVGFSVLDLGTGPINWRLFERSL
jgi:GNAT superfamily N-acetyltransferase